MKSATSSHAAPLQRGFTLIEVLLALFVFALAVISLVECINHMGQASAETRLERRVQSRLDSLLLEATRGHRQQWLKHADGTNEPQKILEEDGISYFIKASPVALQTDDTIAVEGIYQLSVTGRWREDGRDVESSVETWVWPPLFEQNQ